MNPEAWIAIIAIVVVIIGGVIAVYVALSSRLTRIETIFEFVGLEALKALHSDNDEHKLDAFIDHIKENYTRHNYDLTDDQWEEVMIKLKDVTENELAASTAKKLATLVVLFSEHKLMRSGRLGKIEQQLGTKLL